MNHPPTRATTRRGAWPRADEGCDGKHEPKRETGRAQTRKRRIRAHRRNLRPAQRVGDARRAPRALALLRDRAHAPGHRGAVRPGDGAGRRPALPLAPAPRDVRGAGRMGGDVIDGGTTLRQALLIEAVRALGVPEMCLVVSRDLVRVVFATSAAEARFGARLVSLGFAKSMQTAALHAGVI